jgi:hypothetical protein
MKMFKGYEVVTPKYKSWDKGLRLRVNDTYSVISHWKPFSYMWDGDYSDYCYVCLTSNIEERFTEAFTKDMNINEAIEFANRLHKLSKK